MKLDDLALSTVSGASEEARIDEMARVFIGLSSSIHEH